MPINTSDDRYACSNFIVAPTIAEGANYTSIAAALADVSSGETIFLKPGTYTEDLTLVGGVDIAAFGGGGAIPDVSIVGKLTHNDGGTINIHSVRLQTNNDFFLEMSGTLNSRIRLEECYLLCSNNTGISFTATIGNIECTACKGAIQDTGSTLIVSTSPATLLMRFCDINNTGQTAVPSSTSSGQINLRYSRINFPLEATGSGRFNLEYSSVQTSNADVISIQTNGTGTSTFDNCFFDGGTASAIGVGTGTTVNMFGQNDIRSTNADTIIGDGTLVYAPMSFSGSSNNAFVNVTNQTLVPIGKSIEVVDDILTSGDRVSDLGSSTNAWGNLYVDGISFDDGTHFLDDYDEGTYTPTIIGTSGSIGAQVYTLQEGFFTRIGDKVMLWGGVAMSNKGSWTGVATLAGFPFTGLSTFSPGRSRQLIEGRNLTVSGGGSYVMTNDAVVASATQVGLQAGGSGGSGSNQTYANLTNTSQMLYTFIYPE